MVDWAVVLPVCDFSVNAYIDPCHIKVEMSTRSCMLCFYCSLMFQDFNNFHLFDFQVLFLDKT
jgi:hypothetical protein